MALRNIEYASIASSDLLNKNFLYLDEKITELSTSLNTVISSILSNIATINSRLGDITDEIQDDAVAFESKLQDYRTKTRQMLNKISMLPNWRLSLELTQEELSSYSTLTNGYLLLRISKPVENGGLTINSSRIQILQNAVLSSSAEELLFIPLKAGDIVQCTYKIVKACFLPTESVSTEEL